MHFLVNMAQLIASIRWYHLDECTSGTAVHPLFPNSGTVPSVAERLDYKPKICCHPGLFLVARAKLDSLTALDQKLALLLTD